MTKKRRITITIAAGIAVVIALLMAYILYFAAGAKALPGSKIGEVSVTGMTKSQITQALNQTTNTKTVSVSGTEVNATKFKVEDLGVTLDADKTAGEVLAANSKWWKYFTAPVAGNHVKPHTHTDIPKLTEVSQSLVKDKAKAKPPVEPQVIAGKTNFTVKEGTNGRGISMSDLKNHALKVINTQKDVTYKAKFGEVKPLLTTDDLQEKAKNANELLKPKVVVGVGDKEVEPPVAERMKWVDLSTDTPKISDKKTKEWVSAASKPLVVEPVRGNRLVDKSGKVLQVRQEAVAGVSVSNEDEVVKSIVANIETGKDTKTKVETKTAEVEWQEKTIAAGAQNLPYLAAEGEKWIAVNMSNFTTTAYVGAKPVFTGYNRLGAPGTPTKPGTFAVYLKNPIMTMEGYNLDGSKYKTPNVRWAMFYDGGYAIHGAYWVSSFGYNAGAAGSHGCVNMSNSDAQWLYNWAPIGTPVVVHH